jgi:hypothetical protein
LLTLSDLCLAPMPQSRNVLDLDPLIELVQLSGTVVFNFCWIDIIVEVKFRCGSLLDVRW